MSIFKDNDIRGLYPQEWNKETAYQIGLALPEIFEGKRIVIGRDGRTSSEEILNALSNGLMERGVELVDIGIVDTPAVYFSVGYYGFDGGIMITASHNPVGYNGLKLTGKNVVPIEGHTGLSELKKIILSGRELTDRSVGSHTKLDITADYINHLCQFKTKTDEILAVFDCSHGSAGRFIHQIFTESEQDSFYLNDRVDGTFPIHGPNPTLRENLQQLIKKCRDTGAGVGFCFDGDGDRVVMIDDEGEVVSPDLITAILGIYYFKIRRTELESKKVLVDIRSSRSVSEFLLDLGADVEPCPVGHAKIKKLMRDKKAIFAGELTGHYYFSDYYYSDSAWITVFRVLAVLSEEKIKLSDLRKKILKYQYSGEINFKVENPELVMSLYLKIYSDAEVTRLDGLRFDYPDWWFILRKSGTEPLVRLVLESYGTVDLGEKQKELTEIMESQISSGRVLL
jgi:phosphomannomutase